MTDDMPDTATDPRWTPSLRAWIVLGVVLQLIIAGWGIWHYYYGFEGEEHTALLVAQVMTPEDMVYPDTEVAVKRGEQLPPVDMDKVTRATDKMLSDGEKLYAQNCASCHGEQGRGNGPSGAGLDPPPRDLTDLEEWTRGTRLSDIFRTLTLGLEGTQMSAYDYLSPQERLGLSHYVQAFAQGQARDTRASLAKLDEDFHLSEGAREPNVIPISMAVDNEVADATPVPRAPDSSRAAELDTQAPAGAALFAALVGEKQLERAAYVLASDSTWTDSPERLREIITAGTPANGFAVAAQRLSADQWRELHRYATLRFRGEGAG